jgi:protein phosphatase methylesterase 1
MSELQRRWAKAKMDASPEVFNELDEEMEDGDVPEMPEFADDDSSSASSASSTGTIVPSPSRNLFARPQGYVFSRSSL